MQVQVILKAKKLIIADLETTGPASRKHSRGTRYQDVLMMSYTSGIVWPDSDLHQCQALCYSQKQYCDTMGEASLGGSH